MTRTSFDPSTVELEPFEVDPARLSPGTELSAVRLWERPDGSEVRGVWQMTPGVLEGVHGDEMFAVLYGRATVEFADGAVWEVGPGTVGVLTLDDVSRWTVHETLRKTYSVRPS